ncbi:MAG: DUF1294 domain-containing protein [Verrucomicrobia bacterium TMED71]|nr:MAG: DUF1294 domain-containing protein [Verrucomicrobia bacterium TMED71]
MEKLGVPESTLLAVTLLSGEVVAICTMLMVRHNTWKGSFFWKFWPSFVIEVVSTVVFNRARF